MADGSLSGVRGICTIGPLEQTAYALPLKATLVHSAESVALGSRCGHPTLLIKIFASCWLAEVESARPSANSLRLRQRPLSNICSVPNSRSIGRRLRCHTANHGDMRFQPIGSELQSRNELSEVGNSNRHFDKQLHGCPVT
jgi:hypothetical protein